MSTTPEGEYLEVQATLQAAGAEVSPILYDLTVEPACGVIPGV